MRNYDCAGLCRNEASASVCYNEASAVFAVVVSPVALRESLISNTALMAGVALTSLVSESLVLFFVWTKPQELAVTSLIGTASAPIIPLIVSGMTFCVLSHGHLVDRFAEVMCIRGNWVRGKYWD